MRKLLILLAASLFLQGCFFATREPSLPAGRVFKIYVQPVGNVTIQYGLDTTFMTAMTNEMLRDGRLTFVNTPKEADGILTASITRYVSEPLTYNNMLVVEQYKLEILVDVVLRSATNGEVLWGDQRMIAMQIYRASSSANNARNSLFEKLSRNIIRRIAKWLTTPEGLEVLSNNIDDSGNISTDEENPLPEKEQTNAAD
ncbi:MAG: LPS assembly lipoprotein LptE [Elusimicrobiota bacterium]|jgi:hypothetical protein|nr:LPS assembly lipoprotein LptE [Elusimicrobiota bacterium]